MPLAAGQRLGPYEIVAPLGSGGMGEVYRARDARLGRDVAIKVLGEGISRDEGARARFEREVRAVAALSHPNILAIHDLGREGETDFAVMELLEGETLRERLARGPLPLGKIVEIAIQIAQGLAAAHERGIAHRDLKPENLFLTGGGVVKILDFGLAVQHAPSPTTEAATVSRLTAPGVVMGTVGYMAPEQVRGAATDHRADVFAFGCVLYEMLSGRRAFERDTGAEIMTAILREEPEPPTSLRSDTPPVLEQLALHCLEKEPAQRFQSMSDVVFTLKNVTAAASGPQTRPVPASRPVGKLKTATWVVATLALVVATWFAARGLDAPAPLPTFQKLTYQRGSIYSARFAPDGQTVVYGAAWRDANVALFSTRLDATGSRPLGLNADVLAISPSGEMALSLNRHTRISLLSLGDLARAPLGGGAPREMLEDVVDADWSADGSQLAVTREAEGEALLEYPIGHVLHRAGGYLSTPRISPRGDAVAFVKHQVKGDDRGSVALVDLEGNLHVVSDDLPSVTGLAWSADGSEIWYSAWMPPGGYAIEAVTPAGRSRTVFRSAGRIRLLDLRGGRVLISQDTALAGVSGTMRGLEQEVDLSFLDGSCVTDLSADGERLLFTEGWTGGGPGYSFFLRESSTGYPVRLGGGWGAHLSADGKWVLSYPVDPPMSLVITPTGAGTPRNVELPGFEALGGANWLPGEERILFWASKPGETFRGYVIDAAGGEPRAFTPPGVTPPLFTNASHGLTPDGRSVAAAEIGRPPMLYPLDGGEPQPIPGAVATDVPVGWVNDGRSLLVRTAGELPARVYVLDVQSGRRELWKELMPLDPAGVLELLGVVTTPDLRYYAYTYLRVISELHVVEGLE